MSNVFGSKTSSVTSSSVSSSACVFGANNPTFGTSFTNVPTSVAGVEVTASQFSSGSSAFGNATATNNLWNPVLTTGGSNFGATSPSMSVGINPFVMQTSPLSARNTPTFGGFTTDPIVGNSSSVFGSVKKSVNNSHTRPSFESTSSQSKIQAGLIFGNVTTTNSMFGASKGSINVSSSQFTTPSVHQNVFGTFAGRNPVKSQPFVFGQMPSVTKSSADHSATHVAGSFTTTSQSNIFSSKFIPTTSAEMPSTEWKRQDTSIFGGFKSGSSNSSQPMKTQASNPFSSQTTTSLTQTVPSIFTRREESTKDPSASESKASSIFGEKKTASSMFPMKKPQGDEVSAFGNKGTIFAKTEGSNVFGKSSGTSVFGKSTSTDSEKSHFSGLPEEGSFAPIVVSVQQPSTFGSKPIFSLGYNKKQDEKEASDGMKRKLFRDRAEDDGSLARKMRIKRVELKTDDENRKGKSIFDRPSWAYQNEESMLEQDESDNSVKEPSKEELNGDRREELQKRTPFRRMSSNPDDNVSKVAIVCKNVPTKYNQGSLLRKHFSQFGEVAKVFPTPHRRSAVIHFRDHESAAKAKRLGQVIAKETPAMSLFWSSYSLASMSGHSSESSSEDVGKGNSREELQKSTQFRRMSSNPDNNNSRIAIVCKNVPTKYNQGAILRKHFSQFGEVAKVFPTPHRGTAVIHFLDHESAFKAKRDGQVLSERIPPLVIFWSPYSPASKSERSGGDVGKDRIQKHPRWKSNEGGRDNVNEELYSMSGTSDIRDDKVDLLKRPHDSSTKSSLRGTESSTKSTKDEEENIKVLQGSVAKNSSDCYQLLELRDKIFRMRRKKKTDLTSAKAFVGTCLDMCPEKERYQREEQRRLHIYEMIPCTEIVPNQNPQVDHMRAVKEYSRSSADQEEPLAHELRPASVLVRVMHYLMAEIADRGRDGQWGEWYDFLWNRTRSIRKDITQQQLCNRETVELLEKCARFHIFSAARLCEEDMSDFDMKINNENLTKSLQTLKEFYYDLEVKQRSFCTNEAEFRSYIVLMNLNEGDILRDIQQLRPEIQNSSEIHFATSVYSALNSNNYVRFFRFVKDGSFMNSCIMHRYFTQIRTKALLTIQRAYAVGGKSVQFPLSELAHLLAFRDMEEAADFCQHYGYVIDDTDVILDKNSLIQPEQAWMPRRSYIIESKRMVSIGEAINGERVLPFSLQPVACSFDGNGRFIGFNKVSSTTDTDAQIIKRTEIGEDPVKHEVPTKYQEVPGSTQKSVSKLPVSNEVVKSIAKQLFFDVIDEFSKDVATSFKSAVDMIVHTTESLSDEILESCVSSIVRRLCSDVYNDEVLRKKKQDEKELQERIARVSVEVLENIMQTTVEDEIDRVAEEVDRDVKKELQKQCTEIASMKIRDAIVEEETAKMLLILCDEVYQKDVVERLEELHEYEKCIHLHRTCRFFFKWKQAYSRSVKRRRSIQDFPVGPSLSTMSDQLQRLLPGSKGTRIADNLMYLNDRAVMCIGSPMLLEVKDRWCDIALHASSLLHKKKEEKAWQPLDLNRLAGPHLQRNILGSTETIYWKILLALPEEDYDGDDSLLRRWLKTKFTKGSMTDGDMMSKSALLSLYRVGLQKCDEKELAVCVRSVEGTLDTEDTREIEYSRTFLGSHGIVFLMNPLPSNSSDLNFWSAEHKRLTRLLETNLPHCILPLIILTPFYSESVTVLEEVQDYLHLESLIDRGLLKDIEIVPVELQRNVPDVITVTSPTLNTKLDDSVRWLAQHYPQQIPLQVKHIQDFVNDFLQENFFTPVLYDLKERKKKGLLHQGPNVLIDHYNSCMNYLIEVAASPSLRFHSWPVTEFAVSRNKHDITLPPFYWNKEDQLHYLRETLFELSLPSFNFFDTTSEDWQNVQKDVTSFFEVITVEDISSSQVYLKTKINRLLHLVLEDFENTCFLTEGEEDCQPTYVNAPWTDIIIACIDYRLTVTEFCDLNFDGDDENVELMVVYEESELRKFSPSLDWKDAVHSEWNRKTTSFDQTVNRAVHKKRKEKEINEQFSTSKIELAVNKPEVEPTTSCLINILSALEEEKQKSQELTEYLQKTLHSDASYSQTCNYLDLTDSKGYDDDDDLEERLKQLRHDIESHKKAEELLEKRMKYISEQPF